MPISIIDQSCNLAILHHFWNLSYRLSLFTWKHVLCVITPSSQEFHCRSHHVPAGHQQFLSAELHVPATVALHTPSQSASISAIGLPSNRSGWPNRANPRPPRLPCAAVSANGLLALGDVLGKCYFYPPRLGRAWPGAGDLQFTILWFPPSVGWRRVTTSRRLRYHSQARPTLNSNVISFSLEPLLLTAALTTLNSGPPTSLWCSV